MAPIRTVIFTFLTIVTLSTWGVPAKRNPFIFTQPDGSEITVSLQGDERAHFYISEDGHILVNQDNSLYYATLSQNGAITPSSILAKRPDRLNPIESKAVESIDQSQLREAFSKQIEKSNRGPRARRNLSRNENNELNENQLYGLFPGTHFPAQGEQRGIIILVEYQDMAFTVENPKDYYTRMLNEEDFNDDGATGSAKDYFLDNSNEIFQPIFDVYGPVLLDNNVSYYGGNDNWGNDSNPEKMAIEACEKLNDEVDFSLYDGDEDGKIDMVYIIYAGQGEASYGSPNTVWPHSWSLTDAGHNYKNYQYDEVYLDHYACGNEWEKDKPDGIGTFVHEFSHVLGLPDLYSTSYSSAFTPGAYSVLDQGPYNNDGRTPPAYSIFELSALGWADVSTLSTPGDFMLEHIIKNHQGFKISTNKSTEYFLLENRQKDGWDTFIPGHGMLVWHIDYNESPWINNTVNNNSSHQYVDLVEADNSQSDRNRDSDTFPGKQNVTKITDNTQPNLKSWSGAASGFPLYNIAEEEGIVYFRGGIHEEDKPEAPNALQAEDITTTSFMARWEAVDNSEGYFLTVTYEGQPIKGWEEINLSNATKCQVTDLNGGTEYQYYVKTLALGQMSEASNIIKVVTLEPGLDCFAVVATDATEIKSDSFIANWQPLDLATDYLIDLYKDTISELTTHKVDFTGGVRFLPQGWSSTTSYTFTSVEYCGESSPSLRFTSAGTLTSPEFTGDIKEISFWYRGVNTNEENEINIQVEEDGEWITLETFYPNNSEGEIAIVTNISDGYHRMRIEYVETTHRGSIAIDDVCVAETEESLIRIPVTEYTGISSGGETYKLIQGLEPLTTYYYTVTATDGELFSIKSNEVKVTTTEGAGIGSISIEDDNFKIVGNTVISTGAEAYTMDGRIVGRGKSIDLSPGIYLLKTTRQTKKIAITQ